MLFGDRELPTTERAASVRGRIEDYQHLKRDQERNQDEDDPHPYHATHYYHNLRVSCHGIHLDARRLYPQAKSRAIRTIAAGGEALAPFGSPTHACYHAGMDTNGTSSAPPTAYAKRQAERELVEEVAAGYRPTMAGDLFWDPRKPIDPCVPDIFRFFQEIEAMVVHPCVHDAMEVYRSGIAEAQFEVEAASSPEVGRFALQELQRFWKRARPDAQRSYEYGRGAFEVVYEVEDGLLRLSHLIPFMPPDAHILTRNNDYVGIRVRGQRGGMVELAGPTWRPAKGYWHVHHRRYHRWYGWSQLYSAWRPWRRLAARGGAEDNIDGGIYHYAFQPPVGRYPPEDQAQTSSTNTRVSNKDKMKELLDGYKSGSGVALSSRRDEHGDLVWDLDFPSVAIDVSGLLKYTDKLEDAISLGIGVPPELRAASGTSGSGYAGREIPKEIFLLGQQQNAEELYQSWHRQIGQPVIEWNFGPDAWARLIVLDLLKLHQQAITAADPRFAVRQVGSPEENWIYTEREQEGVKPPQPPAAPAVPASPAPFAQGPV